MSMEVAPSVGIIMGSDSDLGVMQHVGRALTQYMYGTFSRL